ncbi:Lysophospholipid acyltransferase 2 [Abeliophyllum distichum]|uniref:Lysophospholipid acyltransferase 2 n=1 Tax=Abeliophyllum distichum TaxID=126358 RepID=A0ABD1VXJ5_9LAMI
MELPEVESMVSAIRVSVMVLRFLLCFATTIPFSFLHWLLQKVLMAHHLYTTMIVSVMLYLSFGFSSNLHFLVPMFLGYASMVLYQKYYGIIMFFLDFGYLIGWYLPFFFALLTEFVPEFVQV